MAITIENDILKWERNGEVLEVGFEDLVKSYEAHSISQKMARDGYCGFVDYECPRCGSTINLNYPHNFCGKCGQKLES